MASEVQKTPNRVSLDDIKSNIKSLEFINPETQPLLTIAVVTTMNGFSLVGKSASADPENHNVELGRKFAEEDALRQMWPLMGYALCEKLSGA